MKKKKKLTGQQIKFIINMVSLAVFAISYLYIYSYYVKEKDATDQEIKITEKYIKTMKDKISKVDTVKQDTVDLENQIKAILDNYPVDITRVDNLLFVEQMEKDLGITLSTLDASDSKPFFTTTLPMRNTDGTEIIQNNSGNSEKGTAAETPAVQTDSSSKGSKSQSDALSDAEAAIGEDADASANAASTTVTDVAAATTMTGMQSTITLNFQTTNEGFKKLVDYINNYPSRTVIDSVSISVDRTTNNLTGSMVIKRYALAGTGKVYETPLIDDISIGTDNIFGTDTGTSDEPAITDEPAATEGPTATEESTATDGQDNALPETP